LSYGYHRAEVLGALCSVLLIWGLLGWLLKEAIDRLSDPEIDSPLIMLITAFVGLAFNIISIFILHDCGGGHGHHHHGDPNSEKAKELAKEEARTLSGCHFPVP
jgi:zinc transporter 2